MTLIIHYLDQHTDIPNKGYKVSIANVRDEAFTLQQEEMVSVRSCCRKWDCGSSLVWGIKEMIKE